MEQAHPLKTYRERAELSQKELGRRLGIPRTTIARWETGVRKIGRKLLPEVVAETGISAKVLRPDLAELLGGAE